MAGGQGWRGFDGVGKGGSRFGKRHTQGMQARIQPVRRAAGQKRQCRWRECGGGGVEWVAVVSKVGILGWGEDPMLLPANLLYDTVTWVHTYREHWQEWQHVGGE